MTPKIAKFSEAFRSGQNVIVFTISDTIFSRLIRCVTKSSVSHCGFYVGSHWIADSTVLHGTKIRSDEEFYSVQKIIHAFKVLDPQAAIANKIAKEFKKGYGFFDVIWLLLTHVVCKRIRILKNPIQDGFICSEFVARYLDRATGSNLYSSSNPPTPEDLLQWCKMNLEEVNLGNNI